VAVVSTTTLLLMSTSTEERTSLVITQPMLMPWHGLFSQLLLSDRILIYDDVQLPRGGGAGRGFMTRVQIKTGKGSDWLSIPVKRSGQDNQRICDALIGPTDWRRQHLARIEQAYRKAPFFRSIFDEVVSPIYANNTPLLADFLVGSMEVIASVFGIPVPFERTSQGNWAREMSKTDRVVEICRSVGARDYISGNGGMDYLDYAPFECEGIRVNYMKYTLKSYPQLHGAFTPYLSLIDLLFCVGTDEAASYLLTKTVYWKDWPNQINGRPAPLSALNGANN
jgi:hypothetical protein